MILGVLIPLSIGMGLIGLVVFAWAMRHGQFEDLDGAAWRIIPPDSENADQGGDGHDTAGGGNPGPCGDPPPHREQENS